MTLLYIGRDERAAIQAAVIRAAENPLPLDLMVRMGLIKSFANPDSPVQLLKDRPRNPVQRPESQHVLIPFGYRASISFEQQREGLTRHLSVSVMTPGRIPNEPALLALMEAFGFSGGKADVGWLEEFAPGHFAVNVVQLVAPRT